MSRRYFRAQAFILLLATIFLFGAKPVYDTGKVRYQIESQSKLYLKGTTNVNEFSCDCTDRFQPQNIEVESKGGHSKFKNTGIRITVQNFNCRNRKIESDLQDAMKADKYPNISIDLTESWQDEKCLTGGCKDWFDVQTKVRITITNVTKTRSIAAKAKVIGKHRFQLRGEESLNMSEFGIKPPHAMFGLIKVNDKITFHFDLIVQADENL